MYGQQFQQSMDQPGQVANPARGQLNMENEYCLYRSRLRTRSREMGSAVPSRIYLLILHIQDEPGANPRNSCRIPRRRLHLPSTAIGSVPSSSGHAAIVYRWRSLPRVRRQSASSPQGSSSNGCCLFRCHHGPVNVRLSFQHPLLVCRNNG